VGDIDISRERCDRIARDILHSQPYSNNNYAAAEMLTALRAALDAAEANINLKADWIDATINDMAQGEQDAAEARAVGVPDAVQALAAALWLEAEGEAVERLYDTTNHAKFVPEYEAKARAILSALHPASPLGAVAMREKALKVCDDVRKFRTDRGDEVGYDNIATGAQDCRELIAYIPLTFTPAELLAAAAELPEVKALVDAAQGQVKLHRVLRPHGIAAEKTDADLRAALAPFARKGE